MELRLAVSVLDISKILERVPVWRQWRRNAEPEIQPHALDAPPMSAPDTRSLCDQCFGEMHIIEQEKLDQLDVFGQVIHTLECSDCGHVTKKIYAARDGYL